MVFVSNGGDLSSEAVLGPFFRCFTARTIGDIGPSVHRFVQSLTNWPIFGGFQLGFPG